MKEIINKLKDYLRAQIEPLNPAELMKVDNFIKRLRSSKWGIFSLTVSWVSVSVWGEAGNWEITIL